MQQASASELRGGERAQGRRGDYGGGGRVWPMIETDRLGIFHLARPFFTAHPRPVRAFDRSYGAAIGENDERREAWVGKRISREIWRPLALHCVPEEDRRIWRMEKIDFVTNLHHRTAY